MRLEPVNPMPVFICTCYRCGKTMHSNREIITADLDGEAFKAYYCALCAKEKRGVAKMRNLSLTRAEAEGLVGLLEDCDPQTAGTWRHDLAADIREQWGMVTLREENSQRKGNRYTP